MESCYKFAKIQEEIDWGRKYVKSFAKLGTYGGLEQLNTLQQVVNILIQRVGVNEERINDLQNSINTVTQMINTNAEVSKLTWLQISEDFNTKMERKIEELKAEMKLLTSEQIKNCDICSGHDDLPEHGPLFQKACEGLILARVIEKARKTLEGSLEGDYLSKFNDINLVDELKMKYLGMDDTSDWGLLEALSTKAIYTEPMTSDILNLSSSSKIIKKVVASKLVSSDVSDVEPEVEMKGMVETKDATGGGDADHEKSYYNFAKIQEQIDWGRKYVKSFAKLGTYGGLAPQPPYCNRNCHESRYCLVVIDKFRERTP